MAKRLSEVKREWFQPRVLATPTTPGEQIQKTFWDNQGFTGTAADQKLQWLRKIITTHGGTPAGNKRSDLLKQAVSALGYTPVNSEGQNWRTLYTNLP